MRTCTLLLALLLVAPLTFTADASAQSSTPKNVVRTSDGKWQPAPGYTWVNDKADDLRVRWVVGMKHASYPNVVTGAGEGDWRPAPGFKWVNNAPGDLRVVRAETGFARPETNEDKERVAKAVLKALGAVVAHQATKPKPGEERTFAVEFRIGLAVVTRDKLIDSALEDLLPLARVAERNSIRNLVVLAFDRKLSQDRDTVLAELKRINPDMADAVQVAEFLIRIAQAAERQR